MLGERVMRLLECACDILWGLPVVTHERPGARHQERMGQSLDSKSNRRMLNPPSA